MAREHGSTVCPDDRTLTGPIRTCVGCRRRAMKRELLRVVVGSDTHGRPAVVPDPEGAAAGRGAHLHPTAECYELAVRRKAFPRALRASGVSGVGLTSTPLGDYLDSRDPRP